MNRTHCRNHYEDPWSRATVPSRVAAGAVTISIVTPGGAAASPTKFMVN
jgi:hypothetical protein